MVSEENDRELEDYKINTSSFDSKEIYNDLIKIKINIPEQMIMYWGNELHTEIEEWDWYATYEACHE